MKLLSPRRRQHHHKYCMRDREPPENEPEQNRAGNKPEKCRTVYPRISDMLPDDRSAYGNACAKHSKRSVHTAHIYGGAAAESTAFPAAVTKDGNGIIPSTGRSRNVTSPRSVAMIAGEESTFLTEVF